jgi:hypothetical protein
MRGIPPFEADAGAFMMFIVGTGLKRLPAAESDLGAEKNRFKRMTENFL